MDQSVKDFGILSAATQETIKKYSLVIFCLFLIHIALFSVYINRYFSDNERHTLRVYTQASVLSFSEFTSGIKLTHNINGKENIVSAKIIYEMFNNPYFKPEIDNLKSGTYYCIFLSSCVYILLLCFFFMREKTIETESQKNIELVAPKTPFEPSSENILAEKIEPRKAINENLINGKELKKNREAPTANPTSHSKISEKTDDPIDKNIVDDDGFTEDDFLL